MKTMKFFAKVALVLALAAGTAVAGTVSIDDAFEAGRGDLVLPTDTLVTGAAAAAEAGQALSLAGDYLAVGSSNEKVRVYKREGVSWELHQELIGPQQAGIVYLEFGEALAFTGDGRQLFVKGVIENNGYFLFRYVRNADGLLVAEDFLRSTTVGDEFGASVAIDGNRMVVGVPNSDDLGGSVYIYVYDAPNDEWDQEAYVFNSFTNPSNMGTSVAIDGDIIAVGTRPIAFYDNEPEVLLLQRKAGVWALEPTRLRGDFGSVEQQFGASLVLSGRTLIIGAPNGREFGGWGNARTGVVHRFLLKDHPLFPGQLVHSDLGRMIPPEGTPRAREFGASLALDGNLLVVGSPGVSDASTKGFFDLYRVHLTVAQDAEHLGQYTISNGRGGAALAFDGCELFVGRPDTGSVDYVTVRVGDGLRERLYGGDGALSFARSIYVEDDGLYRKRLDIASEFTSGDDAQAGVEEAAIRQEMDDLSTQLPGLDQAVLEDLLLDLYYDRALGRLLVAKDRLATLDGLRLENGAPGEYVVDSEIGVAEAALAEIGGVLREHIELLEDPMGGPVTPNADAAGYLFLQEHVPGRALEVPVIGGEPVADVPGGVLADGYKDYRLILQVLVEHARTAVLLGELYRAKGDGASEAALATLVGDTLRFVYQVRVVFDDMFGVFDREAMALDGTDEDLDLALSDLTALHQVAVGGQNLLGYEEDFLLLTQGQGVFDSFDHFIEIVGGPDACLVIDPTQLGGLLGTAISSQDTARGLIDNYKENESTLVQQFNQLTLATNNSVLLRLYDIVGENYPVENPALLDDVNHPYNNPANNQGSGIAQQLDNLELAKLRIERNRVEIDNLRERIVIEVQRRAVEAGVNASIGNVYIEYGNRQASLTEELATVEAAQASWESVGQLAAAGPAIAAAGPVGLAAVLAIQANQAVQITGELAKGELEAGKERLAGQEKARVVELEDQILAANSRALIATTLLEMKTLALDSQEAAILMRQEFGRLVALYTEKENLERRLAEVQGDVAGSFFADPVHRLRAITETRWAHLDFEEAQRWVFFALRSLEYKWNTPFRRGDFSSGDVFRARNAWELARLFVQMCQFDNERTLTEATLKADWFSVKEDFFGYLDGGTYFVSDPDSGEVSGPLSADAAFQKQLEFHLSGDGSVIELGFSTVREGEDRPGRPSNFFRSENYLDKIDWLKVRIPGQHSSVVAGNPNTQRIPVDVSYGGLNFIRQPVAGVVGARPDRLEGEFTTYNTKEWSIGPNDLWRSSERLVDDAAFALLDTSGVRPVASIIPGNGPDQPARCENIMPLVDAVLKFEERSVATTGWTIEIPVGAGGVVIGEVEDVELFFCHSYFSR